MASIGLVSPGAANEGVTPIFFLKITDDLFYSSLSASFYGVTPIYFLLKTDDLFLLITVTFLDFTRV